MIDLIAVYQAAEYHVLSVPPFVMKVGEYSPGFARLHAEAGGEGAIFVTACNPFSIPHSDEFNNTANAELQVILGGGTYPCVGRSAAGDWPEEKSFLSFGHKSAETGYALARQFGQNAFLWIDESCTPMLFISNKELTTEHDIQAEYNLTVAI